MCQLLRTITYKSTSIICLVCCRCSVEERYLLFIPSSSSERLLFIRSSN